MNELLTLLYRDFLEFKRKYISYILLWFLFPMLVYLLMLVPIFEFYYSVTKQRFVVEGMNFINWSSPGIWISCSGVLTFFYSYTKLNNLIYKSNYLDKYLKAPLSNGQLLCSLLIFSTIIGIAQWIVSMPITTALSNDTFNLGFLDLCIIFINITSILLFCSLIGLLSAIYIKTHFFSGFMVLLMFIILSCMFGGLMPVGVETEQPLILQLIRNLPYYKVVSNIRLIYAHKNAYLAPVLITNIINAIIFFIILIISYKKFRK